jgi:hypothetical protein
MKPELQELTVANPVSLQAGQAWAMTAEGESARRRALDAGVELGEDLTNRRSPRVRWPAGVLSGAVVLLLALPALLFLGDESPQSPSTTSPATTTSVTEDTVPGVEQAFYTAVLRCIAEQTGSDFGPVTVDEEGSLTTRGRRALDAAAEGYPGPYQACLEGATGLTGSLVNQTFALSEGEASILIPSGWISTTDDLTPNVGDPWDRVSIGTYTMVPSVEDDDSCALQALVDLSPDDVFIQILERSGPASATPRPPTYAGRLSGIDEGDFWECMSPEERADLGALRFFDFEHEGHQFYVLLALGAETGEDELHTAELVLDSLVIPPEIAAGWTFTEIAFTIREGSAYAIGDGLLFAWGGAPDRTGELMSDGILVNIDTGAHQPISDAPIAPRGQASVVWTGEEFIVFGGRSFTGSLVDGAAYNPLTGVWRLMAPAPLTPVGNPAAVWIDGKMVVWLPGEEPEPNETPQPILGQLASYDPNTDSWTNLDHPDILVVDADLLAIGGDDLILVGGPNVRLQGFYGGPRPLSATVFDSDTQGWSEPITGPDIAAGLAFLLGDGLAVVTEDGAVHLLSDGAWQSHAQLPNSCGSFDWSATSGGGIAYVKCWGNYLLDGSEASLVLGVQDYGSTLNSVFLTTEDGRLVVMGDADEEELASGIVVFGVYEPED